MPKFMTYQRPTPVNKANWTGTPGGNPYQPVRRAPKAAKGPEAGRPVLPVLPHGFKPS